MKNDKIIQITQGTDHILGLSDNGNLYELTKSGWNYLVVSPERDEKDNTTEEKQQIDELDGIIKESING